MLCRQAEQAVAGSPETATGERPVGRAVPAITAASASMATCVREYVATRTGESAAPEHVGRVHRHGRGGAAGEVVGAVAVADQVHPRAAAATPRSRRPG